MDKFKLSMRLGIVFLIMSFMFIQTCLASQEEASKKSVDKPESGVKAALNAVDTQPPSIPGGLAVTNRTYTTVSFGWEASLDDTGVRGYQIYRDGRKIITVSRTSYMNTDLLPGREYTYTIKAYDAAGNISDSSSGLVVATVGDIRPPSAPGPLSVTSAGFTDISLSWKPSSDNTGIKGYEVYCNGVRKKSTSATGCVCKGFTPGTAYTFFVKAYDIAGNYSPRSNYITVDTAADSEAPSVPTGLKASSVTETEVVLVWSPSSDNVKVRGYEIYSDGKKTGSASNTYCRIKKLIPGESRSYTVRAFDASGNISKVSSPVKIATLKDLKAPSAPTGLKVKPVNRSSVSLVWDASADNVKVKGYYIYCNGLVIASTTRTSCSVKNPSGLGISFYRIKAYDLVGNLSAGSNTVTVIT